MKKAVLISIVLVTGSSLMAQQPAQTPTVPVVPVRPMPQPQPEPVEPAVPPVGIPPMQTNQGGGVYYPTPTNPPGMDTNQFPATNLPPAQPINNFPQTNAMNPATVALTNRLSVMTPAQRENVVQVQVNLNSLQDLAVKISGAQNVQVVIQQNPEIQRELHLC